MTMDGQKKERLRHLIAAAVFDVWCQVSGSVAPASVEGTVCITAEGSGTLIVHVDNNFKTKSSTQLDRNCNDVSAIDPDTQGQENMAAYLDDLSPASLTSGSDVTSRDNRASGFSATMLPQHDSGFDSTHDDAHLTHADPHATRDENVDVKPLISPVASASDTAGPICAGTGYYSALEGRQHDVSDDVTGSSKLNESDALEWSFHERDRSDRLAPLMSTPKRDVKRRRHDLHSHKSDALDLTTSRHSLNDSDDVTPRNVADITAASPHSYAEQVRDVIRQRILSQAHNFIQHRPGVSDDSELALKMPKLEPLSFDESNQFRGANHSDARHPSLDDSSRSASLSSANSVFLSPEAGAMLSFPFPPFLSQKQQQMAALQQKMRAANLGLAAGRLQEMMQRALPPVFPFHRLSESAAAAAFPQPHERPSSEPMNLAQSDADKMSTSLEEQHSPQSAPASTEQKVYRCKFCCKTFLFKSKYQEHLPVHTNARPYHCRLCSRTYKYKYDLRVHLRTHLGIPTKSTLCPFCGEKFDTNKLLRQHIKETHRENQAMLSEEQLQVFDAI